MHGPLALNRCIPILGSCGKKTQQRQALKASHDRLTFTETDCLRPAFYQAWFGKARSYVLSSEHELVLEALEMAIKLNLEQCRDGAKTELVFDGLRQMPDFERLIV